MPKFLEQRLKKEYGQKSPIPYKIMNAQGLMRGNKITAKGAAMERAHVRDTKPHVDRGHVNIKHVERHAEKLRHV